MNAKRKVQSDNPLEGERPREPHLPSVIHHYSI
jgi:hypothetical protein